MKSSPRLEVSIQLRDSRRGYRVGAPQYNPAALLVTQRVHGIEPRGLPRGVDAEDQAHTHGHEHAAKDAPGRNAGWNVGQQAVEHQAEASADEHSNDAATAGEHDGFGKELADDVGAARANCLAHANLAGALGD